MAPNSTLSGVLEFGRFRIHVQRRELLADGRQVELGGRAFDVLMVLVESGGSVLSKDDLMSRVWANRVVEENSLQVQISALRRALGDDRDLIRTVAGRGYQFTGEVHARASDVRMPRSPTNLPERVTELIGREAELDRVVNLVNSHRQVTLVGAGGIGKTRLALESARRVLAGFPDGVWLADLAPLADAEVVPLSVATALGLTLAGGVASPERIAAAVGLRKLLVVLDNCEHLIESAAGVVAALLRIAPAVSVLATSREPLRIEGEQVYRVPPLEFPAESAQADVNALRIGAVKLFVTRARESSPGFTYDDDSIAVIGAICRRLDGIPLAIELAAARTAALGVEEMAARLDDRFRLLTSGLRSSLPRHQTLRAALDWSYELLDETERAVLRRLAVFAGAFTLPSANGVITGDGLSDCDVEDSIASLVARSLVTADVSGATVEYRLLETTRAYALEKLIESGEFEVFARCHAEYYRVLFEKAESEWEVRPTVEWLAKYRPCINNIRSALNWAYSSAGDLEIAIALTVAAIPLWFQLSLIDEGRNRVERALGSLTPATSPGPRREMQLHWALGWSLMYTAGPARETGAAWKTALDMAENLGDIDYRLRALWGLWAGSVNNGEIQESRSLADRFSKVAEDSSDRTDALIGSRMISVSLHFLGDQTEARRHIEHMLSRYVAPLKRSHVVRFQFDQRVTARITLARALWLQGFPERALRIIESNVDEALAIDHTLSLCNALAQSACPVAFLAGDLVAAERYVAMYLQHTARLALDVWHAYGRCFNGMLLIRQAKLDEGVSLLCAGVNELRDARFTQYLTTFLAALAECSLAIRDARQGLTAVEEALGRCERGEERWSMAELTRLEGELMLLDRGPDAFGAAEDRFLKSLDWARRQDALSWELRAATSLARLRHTQGRAREARELLAPVYERFTEGYRTADLRTAKTLLEQF